jgi:hypothetical protein
MNSKIKAREAEEKLQSESSKSDSIHSFLEEEDEDELGSCESGGSESENESVEPPVSTARAPDLPPLSPPADFEDITPPLTPPSNPRIYIHDTHFYSPLPYDCINEIKQTILMNSKLTHSLSLSLNLSFSCRRE